MGKSKMVKLNLVCLCCVEKNVCVHLFSLSLFYYIMLKIREEIIGFIGFDFHSYISLGVNEKNLVVEMHPLKL